jgi:hypothetical protein
MGHGERMGVYKGRERKVDLRPPMGKNRSDAEKR